MWPEHLFPPSSPQMSTHTHPTPKRPSLFVGGGGGGGRTPHSDKNFRNKDEVGHSIQHKFKSEIYTCRPWVLCLLQGLDFDATPFLHAGRTSFSPLLCSARDRLQMGQCRRNCGRRTGESVSLHTGAIFHICFRVYVPVTLYKWKRQFCWKRSFTHLYSLRYSILRFLICVCIFIQKDG